MIDLKVEMNPVNWTRDEREQFLEKGFRHRREGEFPCNAYVRPADYDNDLQRGTIEYMPGWKNYSQFHAVIPDGTALEDCNFMQNRPATAAITGKNLTFTRCNMVNCAIDPSWTIGEHCNTKQAWRMPVIDTATMETKERFMTIANHPGQLAENERTPDEAILRRDF